MPFSFGIDIVIGNGTLICQKNPLCLPRRAVVSAVRTVVVLPLAALQSAEHLFFFCLFLFFCLFCSQANGNLLDNGVLAKSKPD